jgi:CheY-like chemotaxis protein
MANILSVSYDKALLTIRQQILERRGYSVTSACGLREALQQCNSETPFDLFIVGHSIPQTEKEALIEHFRANRPAAPVVALKRLGETEVRGANLSIEPTPPDLLRAVDGLVSGKDANP